MNNHIRYFKMRSYDLDKAIMYYRVFPSGSYQCRATGWSAWLSINATWENRLPFFVHKPISVSKLEILIMLGPEALNEVI